MNVLEAYRTLGCDPANSTPAQIKSAYRNGVMQNHPDRVHGTGNEQAANDRTVRLNLAFEYLERSGFPKYVPPPRVDPPPYARPNPQPYARPNPNPYAQAQWTPQPDFRDPDFDTWRGTFTFRDPRIVLREDINRFGLINATTAWAGYAWRISWCATFFFAGILSLPLHSGMFGIGIAMLGALAGFRQLQQLLGNRQPVRTRRPGRR